MLISDIEKEITLTKDEELAISFDEYNRMQQGLMKIKHPNLVIEGPDNKYVKNFIKAEEDKIRFINLMEALNPRVLMKCPHCGKSLNVGVYPGCEDSICDGFGGKIGIHRKICGCGKTFFVNRFITNP